VQQQINVFPFYRLKQHAKDRAAEKHAPSPGPRVKEAWKRPHTAKGIGHKNTEEHKRVRFGIL